MLTCCLYLVEDVKKVVVLGDAHHKPIATTTLVGEFFLLKSPDMENY